MCQIDRQFWEAGPYEILDLGRCLKTWNLWHFRSWSKINAKIEPVCSVCNCLCCLSEFATIRKYDQDEDFVGLGDTPSIMVLRNLESWFYNSYHHTCCVLMRWDNKASMFIASNPVFHEHAKHIATPYIFQICGSAGRYLHQTSSSWIVFASSFKLGMFDTYAPAWGGVLRGLFIINFY